MLERREYKTTIHIFSFDNSDFNKSLQNAIKNINNAGYVAEVSCSSITVTHGTSTYSAVVKGYRVVEKFSA